MACRMSSWLTVQCRLARQRLDRQCLTLPALGHVAPCMPCTSCTAAHQTSHLRPCLPVPPLQGHIRDTHGGGANPLLLGADAPAWVYSTAPLAMPDGKPVAGPTPGSAGHAMFLSDQQVCLGVRLACATHDDPLLLCSDATLSSSIAHTAHATTALLAGAAAAVLAGAAAAVLSLS